MICRSAWQMQQGLFIAYLLSTRHGEKNDSQHHWTKHVRQRTTTKAAKHEQHVCRAQVRRHGNSAKSLCILWHATYGSQQHQPTRTPIPSLASRRLSRCSKSSTRHARQEWQKRKHRCQSKRQHANNARPKGNGCVSASQPQSATVQRFSDVGPRHKRQHMGLSRDV